MTETVKCQNSSESNEDQGKSVLWQTYGVSKTKEKRPLDPAAAAFVARVEFAWKTSGKTRQQVEQDGEMGRGAMSHILNGDRGKNTGQVMMSKLARGLGVNKAWLEDGIEPMRTTSAAKIVDIDPEEVDEATTGLKLPPPRRKERRFPPVGGEL